MGEWCEKNIFVGSRPYLIIMLLGFLLYAQALFFNFTYLDDNTLILDNQSFLSNFSNIPLAFQTDVFHLFNHSASYYRPLLTLSFMLDYRFGGAAPFFYHFVNIILHLLATCLVFIFLQKLDYRKDLAFLFSLIFLVHPVLTQAVAWIPGRNDSLAAIFMLAFFNYFFEYLKNVQRKNLIWFFVFFTLALFTKETALFSVPIIIFYLYFINREKLATSKKMYLFSVLTGIIGLWFIFRHLALLNSTQLQFSYMLKSVFLNLPALVQFIGKIIFPFNLSVLPIVQDTSFVYGILALIVLGGLLFFTKIKRWSYILFGLGWFLAFLLPSFIRPNPYLTADFIEHRLYVPLIGFFIILLETDLARKFDCKKKSSLLWAGALIFILGSITLVHSRNFANRLVFWDNAAQNSPHYPLARRNLGAMFYLDKKFNEAEREFKAALELNPTEEMAHNNLGLIYTERQDYAKAEEEFGKELEINPYYDNAYTNRGLLYYKMGKQEQAIDDWKKALEINPGQNNILYNLAALYYEQKNFSECYQYAQEIARRGLKLPVEFQALLQSTNASPLPNINLKK